MTFIQNLNWRYAVKKFNSEKVSQENIQKIKDAIRYAPSSFGTQPYHVVLVENVATLQGLKSHAKNNEAKFDTCSHMFVFCSRTDVQGRFEAIEKLQGRPKGFLSQAGKAFQYFMPFISIYNMGRFNTKNFWARNQTYIALGFALAACAELSVDSCPMEGFDARAFSRILKLDSHIKPVALLAVGVRSPEDTVYPKSRFPESDLFTII
jgi:nitroreductase / dihydropteridine reductase